MCGVRLKEISSKNMFNGHQIPAGERTRRLGPDGSGGFRVYEKKILRLRNKTEVVRSPIPLYGLPTEPENQRTREPENRRIRELENGESRWAAGADGGGSLEGVAGLKKAHACEYGK